MIRFLPALSFLLLVGLWVPHQPESYAPSGGMDCFRVTATGYSSEVRQTDSTPFITATGNRVRVGTLAVSGDLEKLLPMGTRVFVVDDRMHKRWVQRVDFWFPTRYDAVQWGKRELVLRVHE